ncbi:MAG TPA: 3-oxoacyl-ACP synthase, partial [Paenalcaligenes sp.]|nr:3-oxoacyl-ACP synthase [Paenalcaligenes sp.]
MMPFAKIIGTGAYLPPNVVSNDQLAAELAEKGVETS